ncbi:MAG: hypothetical protein U0625_09785 [Phycisphaerales bacterium]
MLVMAAGGVVGCVVTVVAGWMTLSDGPATEVIEIREGEGAPFRVFVCKRPLITEAVAVCLEPLEIASSSGLIGRLEAKWTNGVKEPDVRQSIIDENMSRVREGLEGQRQVCVRMLAEARNAVIAGRRADLPAWLDPKLGYEEGSDALWSTHTMSASGWPFRAITKSVRVALVQTAPPYVGLEVAGVRRNLSFDSPDRRDAEAAMMSQGSLYERWVRPAQIWWPGLLADLLVWSLLTFALQAAISSARSALVARGGNCPGCGRVLDGAGRCVECRASR